jgi:hypothetical protein
MLEIARRELAHIPDWPFHQRLLRATYWNMRLNSLGRKPEFPDHPLQLIRKAIEICAKTDPAPTYEFDEAFFEHESRMRQQAEAPRTS